MDKIVFNHMQFFGYHGVLPEENKLGQRYTIDLVLYLSLQRAGKSDNLNDTIDYSHVYQVVKKIVEEETKALIEAVAETIAGTLLQTFPMLEACTVRVIKPDPPISGYYESIAVEIYRERER